MSCNNTLFNELIDFLLTELGKNTTTSTTRTYIQCVGAIRFVQLFHNLLKAELQKRGSIEDNSKIIFLIF